MRIFYSNITYGCNSNCVFCYSHNTHHNGYTYNEISVKEFIEYLRKANVTENDRVIINGGEPLLHSEIEKLLHELSKIRCEILIYTNGRLLDKLPKKILTNRMRFVVPIHGYQELHDKITGVVGSYEQTLKGLEWISSPGNECLVDIKIIINNQMHGIEFKKVMDSLENVKLNHAVHITKMADTIISKSNKCGSVNNELAAMGTKRLYDYYVGTYKLKIFDTCVREIGELLPNEPEFQYKDIIVYFKDWSKEFNVELEQPFLDCHVNCKYKNVCLSAVGEYIALEIDSDNVSIGLE